MKHTPIMFTPELIPKLRNNEKTQTRRTTGLKQINQEPGRWRLWYGEINGVWQFTDHPTQGEKGTIISVKCPYGTPGDRLWVKEPAYISPVNFGEPYTHKDDQGNGRIVAYRADGINYAAEDYGLHVRPAMFMPRWASRITLIISQIRLQRLKDIREEDAEAEGIERARDSFPLPGWIYNGYLYAHAKHAYFKLWDDINQKTGYPSTYNPWLWAIAFRLLTEEA